MPNHRDLLGRIRLAFPQPVSDHVHDAYFSHLVHHALDLVVERVLAAQQALAGGH